MSITKKRHIYHHERGYGGLWPILLVSLSMIMLSSHASAKTIWRIGEKENDSASEFGIPGSTGSVPAINQEVVYFSPPQDPNNYDWQSFPSKIWPPEAASHPKEIHITYDYPRDLRCPVLRIRARSAVKHFTQGLIVIKGGGETLSRDLRLPSFYTDANIPVGVMWKGLHEENTLIIKNTSLASDNHSILFEYMELLVPDFQDQDGDGSLDNEEVEGDMDQDGTANTADPDTVTLVIQTRDSTKSKKITLDLQENNEQGPLFTSLIPFFTSSPDINKGPPGGFYFPYGLFRAYINIPIETDVLAISLYIPEDPEDRIDYDNTQFCLYEENEWRVVPVEILSQHALRLSIELENDQESEEGDYIREFVITGGLAYPDKLDIDLENTGPCLIKSLRD